MESGSIHFPAKPGIASWPATGWIEEVVNGAKVPVGSAGGNITGGNVADERVADGSVAGINVGGGGVANRAVSNDGMVALRAGMR